MYTKAQLDGSVTSQLPATFDDAGGELVESVNQVCFPVEELLGFGRVLSTTRRGQLNEGLLHAARGHCCHQENVFVNDGRKGKWTLKAETPSRTSVVGSRR